MTKCVITGCKNKGLRPCSFMKSGWHSYDLFCDECHLIIEMMYLAQDSRRLTNPSPRQINKYIDDMIEQAQKGDWNINQVFIPLWKSGLLGEM